MQFQVPQFIDVEDKAIGPLTIKQFLYVLLAGIFVFILFRFLNFFVFILLLIPIAGLTYALAFVKIHNQPFIKVVKNFFGFLKKPDFYVWKKSTKKVPAEEKKVPKIIKKTSPKRKIKPAAKKRLQEVGWKIEIEK
jgi:hypothetical protein